MPPSLVPHLNRALHERGTGQIARLTGQQPSEGCEISKGRTVRNVTVLERIADGLDISARRHPVAASLWGLGRS